MELNGLPALPPAAGSVCPAAAPAADGVYAQLRTRWRACLLGGAGDDLQLDDPAVQAYVGNLNEKANRLWHGGAMKKDMADYCSAVFSDLPMSGAAVIDGTASGNMGTTLQRLRTLSLAWATKGCKLYQNPDVLKAVKAAADYVVGTHFKKGRYSQADRETARFGNWYHWEVTCPMALGDLTMILYNKLTPDQVGTYAQAMRYYVNSCTSPMLAVTEMTGGNLLLKAYPLAQAGILLHNPVILNPNMDKGRYDQDEMGETLLDNVKRGVSGVIAYNAPSMLFQLTSAEDGFYADGSFIQHQGIPYIAGYGADLYQNYGILAQVLLGTGWDVRPGTGGSALPYDFVFNGIEPFIAGDRAMDMAAGRDITRSHRDDRTRLASVLSALLLLRGTFPAEEQNRRFDAMMKYYISQAPDFFYRHMDSIQAVQTARSLILDNNVRPRSGYALTKTFAMDRTVHHTDGFTLGIAMQSARTFAHELINGEGKRTWNIANGMVFLYDCDKSQYSDGYWCTVDPTRLPGTTAEHKVYSDGFGDRSANIYDWTGGSSIGGSGAAGMHMKALSGDERLGILQSGPRGGANMKKSWFLFGDRILMLGSSITSTSPNRVETIVENRKIKADGSNTVTVDGRAITLSASPFSPTKLKNPKWMHLEGNVDGADIGYYFPQDITLHALKDTRAGNWAEQGAAAGIAVNTYATFYVDHGVGPMDASYAYVLLPGRTAGETEAYAEAPDLEILALSGAVHAARDNRDNVTAANFWSAGSAAGITVDKPASITIKREGGLLTVGVSDPMQRNAAITVTLTERGALASKDSTVTVDESSARVKFTVDTTNGLGRTYTVVFQPAKEKPAPGSNGDRQAPP